MSILWVKYFKWGQSLTSGCQYKANLLGKGAPKKIGLTPKDMILIVLTDFKPSPIRSWS